MPSLQIAQVSNLKLAVQCTWHNLVFHILHNHIPFLSVLWCLCRQLFVQEARLHNLQEALKTQRYGASFTRLLVLKSKL